MGRCSTTTGFGAGRKGASENSAGRGKHTLIPVQARPGPTPEASGARLWDLRGPRAAQEQAPPLPGPVRGPDLVPGHSSPSTQLVWHPSATGSFPEGQPPTLCTQWNPVGWLLWEDSTTGIQTLTGGGSRGPHPGPTGGAGGHPSRAAQGLQLGSQSGEISEAVLKGAGYSSRSTGAPGWGKGSVLEASSEARTSAPNTLTHTVPSKAGTVPLSFGTSSLGLLALQEEVARGAHRGHRQ